MINDNKLCSYIYQRPNKTINNQCPNKVLQNNELCSKHNALLKYNISRKIGMVRNCNKNIKFIKENENEVFDNFIKIENPIHQGEKMSDICSIIDNNDDNDDINDNNEINDVDIIISKLQTIFDERYELKGKIDNTNNSNGSGFNMNTMMMLIMTSLIPIIIKKIGVNNIGNIFENATDNKTGDGQVNTKGKENTASGETTGETTQACETISLKDDNNTEQSTENNE